MSVRTSTSPATSPSSRAVNGVAVGLAGAVVHRVAQQVGGGDDPLAAQRDERRAAGHPRVDDDLARLALELAEHRVDRDRPPRHDGLDVGVDERGELLAVTAPETGGCRWATTRQTSSVEGILLRIGGRHRCGTRGTYRSDGTRAKVPVSRRSRGEMARAP
jgi:hypothetical protein